MQKFFVLLFCFILLLSCTKDLVKVKIIDHSAPQSWQEKQPAIGQYDEEKIIFFYGYGESRYKDTAREIAQLNAAAQAAVSLDAIVKSQIQLAFDDEKNTSQTKGIISVIVDNVNVSGMRKTSEYWEEKLILEDPNTNPPKYKPSYSFTVQYAMSYNDYVARRNQGIKEAKLPKDKIDQILARLAKEDQK